jgi:hypothetical protein
MAYQQGSIYQHNGSWLLKYRITELKDGTSRSVHKTERLCSKNGKQHHLPCEESGEHYSKKSVSAVRGKIMQTFNVLTLKKLAGGFTLLLLLLLSPGITRAQDSSPCEGSTVEDAWGAEVASQAKSFLATLQRVVKINDKAQFALLAHYPLRVLDGNHKIEIVSATDLNQKYSTILVPDVRQAILGQSAQCLFANGQGAMIGKGQVWFQKEPSGEMKIITINLGAPKQRIVQKTSD